MMHNNNVGPQNTQHAPEDSRPAYAVHHVDAAWSPPGARQEDAEAVRWRVRAEGPDGARHDAEVTLPVHRDAPLEGVDCVTTLFRFGVGDCDSIEDVSESLHRLGSPWVVRAGSAEAAVAAFRELAASYVLRASDAPAASGGGAADDAAETAPAADARDPDGGAPVPPGIYRVGIVGTFMEHSGGSNFLCWEMSIDGPLGRSGQIVKRSRVDTPEDGLALRREFAVLGINLCSWRGLDRARGLLVNREAFVEVLPSTEPGWNRVHVLQRATAHDLALPGDHGLTDWERDARRAALDFTFHAPVRQVMAAEHPDGTVDAPCPN